MEGIGHESLAVSYTHLDVYKRQMGIHEIEIFLDTSSGSTFSNSVYGCVDTTWIANTGISHLKCVGLEHYLKISW